MRTRMNLVRFFWCLSVVAVIGMTIACAEPTARLTRSEDIGSDDQLKRYTDYVRNYYSTFGKARHGKRSDAAPVMELDATWKTLKMIQDAQRQQQRQENVRQNTEQVLLRDFPSSDTDEYTSYDATRSVSLPDIISNYYNDVQ
ncbi:uncharacterized protein LOC112456215 [Temnothorax curvispinosus]|uniref:Uncharacterized protein LOC112456215 n=1 Tax=Temnothorax curvispinosus TaxID=300111 RepID=A0A6J1PYF0_9HYME|nr:uncharacterized protein LOC112456215 [Temnothorax curvispinosus]XP_024874391.1 uncharacterized protein LOC112456215 [Temnothorax curvispinosus]XP_024874393.1 uncharacterized protein LOC112456215 [Temnothorax curvispinosus]